MPKLERLEWIAHLSEGRGVTITDDPEVNSFLAEDPNALLLGVLYDSQYQTQRAFAIPFVLRGRLGHLEMSRLATEEDRVRDAFLTKPALHRFPNRFATLTSRLAGSITESYGGDSSQIWRESMSVDDLAVRLMALPAFGPQKTDWTIGMLGRMGVLDVDEWEGFRIADRNPSHT